jgi:hypothetical protein
MREDDYDQGHPKLPKKGACFQNKFFVAFYQLFCHGYHQYSFSIRCFGYLKDFPKKSKSCGKQLTNRRKPCSEDEAKYFVRCFKSISLKKVCCNFSSDSAFVNSRFFFYYYYSHLRINMVIA